MAFHYLIPIHTHETFHTEFSCIKSSSQMYKRFDSEGVIQVDAALDVSHTQNIGRMIKTKAFHTPRFDELFVVYVMFYV